MKKILFQTRIPLFWFFIVLPLIAFILSNALYRKYGGTSPVSQSQNSITPAPDCSVNMDQIRENKFAFVKPLLLTDVSVQDNKMASLKAELQLYINQKVSAQSIQSASVYVRKVNSGSYICINENELFNPASLMKVAYLISYLKEEEEKPGLLQKKLYFEKRIQTGNNQNIVSFQLKEKSYYTVESLLHAMIVYSDNDATTVLMQNLNTKVFEKIFTDLRLPPPPNKGEYFISASDYAKLFRVIYSCTYLGAEASDYAMRLLTGSNFAEGICSAIDPGVPIAHKFGERVINSVAQLHEFGIVYLQNEPYLIGVMTKGNNLEPLKKSLGEISGIVYRYMKSIS